MEITAAVLYGLGRPLQVRSIDLAPPRAGEVLVKMRSAGVCHSDYHLMTGHSTVPLPVVLGHEGAGEVAALGPGAERLEPGDRVVLNWLPACRRCWFCERGREHLCRDAVAPFWEGTMADGTSRMSGDGTIIMHSTVSTWAEYTVVPQETCVPIERDVPFEVAALMGCAVATGVGAVRHRAAVEAGSSVAVFGVGGVGLSIVMGARLAGAERIVAIDQSDAKRQLALDLGATEFVVAGDDAPAVVRDLTGGRGADYVFEAIGLPGLQEACLDATRRGGTLVYVGIAPMGSTTPVPAADLARTENTIMGSYFAATDPVRALADLQRHYLDGALPVDRLISGRYELPAINDAIDAMLSGAEGRGVIRFGN